MGPFDIEWSVYHISVMKTLRKTLSTVLAAALAFGTQGPLIARAMMRGAPVRTTPSTGGPAPVTQSWQLYPKHSFMQDFPGFSSLGSLPDPDPSIQALRRTLARAGTAPQVFKAMTPTDQIGEAREVVRTMVRIAVREAKVPDSEQEDLTAGIEKAAESRARIRDLRLALALLPREEREDAAKELEAARETVERRFNAKSNALVRSKINSVASKATVWNGRTADIPLEDGSVLSFKRHALSSDLRIEGERMEDAGDFGIDAPIPLRQTDGTYLRTLESAPKHLSKRLKAEGPFGEPVSHLDFLPYLKPKALAGEYQSYLNDKLPGRLNPAQKAGRIEAAAMKAVDHMLILHQNGRGHETLMPISHHGARWEWDYWRWNPPFLGAMRFGPSFINKWREGFAYPNLRLSGLADFEHIQPWKDFEAEHKHGDHRSGKVFHDAYSSGMGQNLTELSFIILHSGAVNKIGDARTAEIVQRAVGRYLEGLLPAEAREGMLGEETLKALRLSSRRLRMVRTFGFGLILTLGVTLLGGLAVVAGTSAAWTLVVMGFLGVIIGAHNAPGNMPGWAVHPLIMDVVKPVVERLRERSDIVGPDAKDHPSGSQWKGRLGLLLAFALVAAVAIPAGAFFAYALIISQLLSMAAGIVVSTSSLGWAAVAGASLFPVRLLAGLIGSR